MHALHMSSFRVLRKKRSRQSFKLGELNDDQNIKAYDIAKDLISGNFGIPLDDVDSKTIVSLPTSLNFDDNKRIIYGYVNVGRYGEDYTVRQKNLSSTDHKKINHDEVTEQNRYIFIYLPDSLDIGIVAFHETARLNARKPIKNLLENGFKNRTTPLEARIYPLLHKEIPRRIKDSPVTEIRAIGYKTSNDTADAMRLIGNRATAEFIVRNKGYSMGIVSDFLSTNKTQNQLIDILNRDSEKIKITAQVNGKPKVYELNDIVSKGISITLDDGSLNLDPITKKPEEQALHNSIKQEINDYLSDIYGQGYSI